jgi:hypothetical protein
MAADWAKLENEIESKAKTTHGCYIFYVLGLVRSKGVCTGKMNLIMCEFPEDFMRCDAATHEI